MLKSELSRFLVMSRFLVSRQHIHRVLDTCAEVAGFEVGVVIAGDLVEAKPLADQFQHALDGNARAGDTGLAEMNLRVDRDSILHEPSLADRARRR